jgi:hypothetical protein
VVTHLKPGLTVDARGIPTPSGAAWTSTAVLRVQRRLDLARWPGTGSRSRFADDEKGVSTVHTPGGPQRMRGPS